MESFLDLIFSNLFLIIIILSSIFSLLNKNSKEEKKKTPNRPKPKPTSSRQSKEQPYPSSKRMEKHEPVAMKTVEDQKQEQMELLRERYQTNSRDQVDTMTDMDLSRAATNLEKLKKKNAVPSNLNKQQLELKFNQKSVLQGIMMSEVLGPPRSRKAYRSVIEERKIK